MSSADLQPRADRPKRRVFINEYKLAIVAEYDALSEPGARGALLRREGLYHSHLIEWHRARAPAARDVFEADKMATSWLLRIARV